MIIIGDRFPEADVIVMLMDLDGYEIFYRTEIDLIIKFKNSYGALIRHDDCAAENQEKYNLEVLEFFNERWVIDKDNRIVDGFINNVSPHDIGILLKRVEKLEDRHECTIR